MARRHMLTYGTTPEQLATVAATIRTNGHVNPEAVYYGRGPFSPGDILESRMIADPFHLLDCATTSEGGCAIVLVASERAGDCRAPLWILGGASDSFGPAYTVAPVWDFQPRADAPPAGLVGAPGGPHGLCDGRSAPRPMSTSPSSTTRSPSRSSGSSRHSASARPGEGGPFVEDGNIGTGARPPGHHRRRDDVVQPSGDQRPAVAAGHQGRPTAPRFLHHEPGRWSRGRAVLERWRRCLVL